VDFLSVVGSRRTIRWFRAWQPVPKEKVQRILEVARLCTSPGNLQPWRAVVVERDELPIEVREELLKADNWQGAHVQAPLWIYWFADPEAISPESFLEQTYQLLEAEAAPREYGWDEQGIKEAFTQGVETPQGVAPIHEWYNLPPAIVGAMAAQETNGACVLAAMAAVNEGLGTALHVLSKPSMVPRVKELLGVPERCIPVWVQLVGYPAEDPSAGGQRPRRPFNELFFSGKWGEPFQRDNDIAEELKKEGLLQPEAPLPWRRDENRNLARMYGYPEI
jgi:nitroreductase